MRRDQKDTDTLPEHTTLDRIIFALNEQGKSCEEVVNDGFDRNDVENVLALYNKSASKLYQIPQILNVSSKPLAHKSKWLL